MALYRCGSGGGGGTDSDYYNDLKMTSFYSTITSFTRTINLDDKVFVVASQTAAKSASGDYTGLDYTELFDGDDITLQFSSGGNTYKTRFQRSGTSVTVSKVSGSGNYGYGYVAILSHVDS